MSFRKMAIENLTGDRPDRVDEVLDEVRLYLEGKIDAYKLSLALDRIRESEEVSLMQEGAECMTSRKEEMEEALVG